MSKHDPTQTTALRRRFMNEMGARFRRLKGRIRETIVEQDGFGLTTNRGRFEFTRDERKVEAFMAWLREAQREEVLEVSEGVPLSMAGRQAWTRLYIDTAYQRGIRSASARMRKRGAEVEDSFIDSAFNRSVHADRVGLIYIRVFEELRGITATMDSQISRELALGLAEGRNPLDIARSINNRVDKIGRTRARTLARTEVISAHAEGALNAYEEAGVEGVEVEAEFSTAGDDRVCPECEALEGRIYTKQEARGVIPVHPNCRCTWIPAIDDMRGEVLR